MLEIISVDWPGILLIFMTFLIIYRYWKNKRDKKLSLTVSFLVLLHHIIALINIYIVTFPGAEGDPSKFYHIAKNWVENGEFVLAIGTKLYVQFLGIFFRIFGPSKLLGEELSILFFLFSCIILIKIVELLGIAEYTTSILLIYGLLPTNLIFCSKILREAYQLYFFMASIYWGLRFNIESRKNSLIMCAISVLLMGLFQRGLVIYALILLPLLLLWPHQVDFNSTLNINIVNKRRLVSVSLVLFCIIGLIVSGIIFKVVDMEAVESFLKGHAFQYVSYYRERLILKTSSHARANYGILLDISSPIQLIKSALHIYFYYLFMPFPWQVCNWLDFYAFTESFFRLILMWFSLVLWYREKDKKRRSVWSLLLFVYFSMTFLWAMGTINYGQGIRHHLLTNWIIIILGIYGFTSFLNCKQSTNII